MRITFIDGCKVSIPKDADKITASFINSETGELVYKVDLSPDCWASPTPKFYVKWRIILNRDDVLLDDYTLDLTGKRVLIHFDSKALGDTLAWIPYVEEFRKKHNCQMFVATHWNSLFYRVYPEINFIPVGGDITKYYAAYFLGIYDNDTSHHKVNWRVIPLQQVATDMLGLSNIEIKPRVSMHADTGLRFSLVMPTHNRPEMIQEAVGAILKQDFQDWELIIKDGGDSVRVVVPKDSRIKYEHAPQAGFTSRLNRGLKEAKGQILSYQCDDDVMSPGTLSYISENIGEAGWLYGLVTVNGSEGTLGRPWSMDLQKQDNFVPCPAAFWTRELQHLVGYHEAVSNHDYDYWMRLGAVCEPKFVRRVLADYRLHSGSLSVTHAAEVEEGKQQIIKRIAVGHYDTPYVCFSEFSTFYGKLWSYPNGWQTVIDHLNNKGYRVLSISQERTELKRVELFNDAPIHDTIFRLAHAKLYIGPASGLSWLAWALGVPVVIISGFTDPISEMCTGVIHVNNHKVCHGCYNDPHFEFKRGDWWYCPREHNFECSSSITSDQVIQAVEQSLMDYSIHTRKDSRRKAQDMDVYSRVYGQDEYGLCELAKKIQPKVILDIGGHIGSFGMLARKLWPDAKIIAYEPNHESAQLYRKNVPDAFVHTAAVSYSEAKNLVLAEDDLATGGGILMPADDLPQGRHATAEGIITYSLEDVFESYKLDSVDLLKLDCEGSEIDILQNMSNQLPSKIGTVLGEYHYAKGYVGFSQLFKERFFGHTIQPLGDVNGSIGDFIAEPTKEITAGVVTGAQPKRVLYVAPHLSTGGLPQYTLWCVKQAKASGCQVAVCEHKNVSNDFVIQRNKIKAECGVFQDGLHDALLKFHPDVVHLQEFPEGFLNVDELALIYSGAYRVIETTHDSNFDINNKKTRPDMYVFVSEFHKQQFATCNVPQRVIPYTIPNKLRPDRNAVLAKLELDPSKAHILNVGLWTPNKNQGEVLRVAACLPDYQFHFVGNRAGNFQDYWGKLQIPPNCRVWGERENVDDFYSSMDIFLFPSKSELMPLAVIEALAWGMPVYMRNLKTYCGAFSNRIHVTFIDEDVSRTVALIQNYFGINDALARCYAEV